MAVGILHKIQNIQLDLVLPMQLSRRVIVLIFVFQNPIVIV